MRFAKMHGCGNEYVLVDCRLGQAGEIADPAETAVRVSDRRRGIGADGLILVQPSAVAAVRMEMYNADGSRGAMCGNGIRCLGKLVLESDPEAGKTMAGPLPPRQLAERFRSPPSPTCSAQVDAAMADALETCAWFGSAEVAAKSLHVETDAGVKRVYGFLQDGRVDTVMVDMGPVSLRLADMNCTLDGETAVDRAVEIQGQTHLLTCVSVGNFHAVVFAADVEAVPLDTLGPALERAVIFPDRVNVHFVQVLARDALRMRSWERGSGATAACGTGACAAVAAAVATGRGARRCRVDQPGGWVSVHLGETVLLTGPAETLGHGQWPPTPARNP